MANKELKEERIIKSKRRVQKHGEVFTPKWMVKKMLDNEGIKEACENLTATFLEPSAGEGAFLIEILRRKLAMVKEKYCQTIGQFENFSLYALSTLYGIELLEDNAQKCVMNLFEVYRENYSEVAKKFSKTLKQSVLNSAKVIISSNIAQGNFLTRKSGNGESILFSEWKMINKLNSKTKTISVARTEYTLDEIFSGKKNEIGSISQPKVIEEQLDIFEVSDMEVDFEVNPKEESFHYVTVKITNVYKEELESDDD